ncbi:MAG: hypothetical protein PVI91_16790 [Gammaproteobacteria bacterium]|jgi:hypothetical protein
MIPSSASFDPLLSRSELPFKATALRRAGSSGVEFSSHFPQPDASDSELEVSVSMRGYARNLIADLGPLRAVLLLLGLLSAAFTPLAGDGIDYEGWGLGRLFFLSFLFRSRFSFNHSCVVIKRTLRYPSLMVIFGLD